MLGVLGDGVRDRLTRLQHLGTPVDGTSIAVLRIAFGVIVAWDAWRLFDRGFIREYYVRPDHHFTWWLFDWVRPHHGVGIYIAFAVLGVAALLLAAGFHTRIAAVVVFAGLAYWFLMDKLHYLNHHYLGVLLGILFVIAPTHRAWSVDARRRPGEPRTVPTWSVWLLRFQVGVPYFFGGIAKLNFDWLVRLEPMRFWLANRTDFPLIGGLFTAEPVVMAFAWGSALLDLSVPFLLLHRRTRAPAFGLALAFHFLNSRLFTIGIFPWLMILATTIFFEPDWPRRLLAAIRGGRLRRAMLGSFCIGFAIGGLLPKTFALIPATIGGIGVVVLVFHLLPERLREPALPPTGAHQAYRPARALVVVLVAWVLIQILLPLRHFMIPGNAHWTEEGNRFAWHMLLKHSTAGYAFVVTDPATGESWIEDVERHVTARQLRGIKAPDLVLQLAHIIEDHHRRVGRDDVVVRVGMTKELNLRDEQLFLDPDVDLTEIDRPYVPPADWILPLEPFRGPVRLG